MHLKLPKGVVDFEIEQAVGGKMNDVLGIIGSNAGNAGIRFLKPSAELRTFPAVNDHGLVQIDFTDVPYMAFRISAMCPHCTKRHCTAYNRKDVPADND